MSVKGMNCKHFSHFETKQLGKQPKNVKFLLPRPWEKKKRKENVSPGIPWIALLKPVP